MSGFKDDIISILKSYSLIQLDSAGLVLAWPENDEVVEEITKLGGLCMKEFPKKPVIRFDYIVFSERMMSVPGLLEAFSILNIGGIIVMEVTSFPFAFKSGYVSLFGNFSITKVFYGNNQYLVIHNGVDYGN